MKPLKGHLCLQYTGHQCRQKELLPINPRRPGQTMLVSSHHKLRRGRSLSWQNRIYRQQNWMSGVWLRLAAVVWVGVYLSSMDRQVLGWLYHKDWGSSVSVR